MNSRKIVFHESAVVLAGEAICTVLMFGVFALLGAWDMSVLLGGIVGLVLATGNFFFMALCTDIAADKGAQQDVKGGQALIQLSYIVRLLALFLILVLCAKSGLFNLIALVLPLVFVRPVLTISELSRKKGDGTK